MAKPTKPTVLICSTPVSGHIIPMRTIAKHLVARGYEVTFVTASGYREYIETAGAKFVPVQGYGDFYDLRARDLDVNWPQVKGTLVGVQNFVHDVVHVFCKSTASQHEALQRALRTLYAENPDQHIVLMTESLNFAALPLMHGAPGLRPTAFMAIGLNPMLLTSIDHAPFGTGIPPDGAPEGRKANELANLRQKHDFALAQSAYADALMGVGAHKPDTFLLDALYAMPDAFVQMCTPSVEYPRSDAPGTIRFAGGYPEVGREKGGEKPGWWGDVIENGKLEEGRRKRNVIFVCQGTVARDTTNLLIPTLGIFAERQDLLIVASLGWRGSVLPASVNVPSNARVVDYLPYDDILPFTDLFITTGGYGSFQRALKHGVPLVIAATSEEKPETAARAEWAGVAVNLRTSEPSEEELKEGVERVLGDERFKKRAQEIREEIVRADPVDTVVESLEEVARIHGT